MSDQSKVIEAERIVVKDKEGRVRIELGCTPDGSAGIRMFDTDRRRVCGLAVDSMMKPVLIMFDKREVPRVNVGLDHEGSPIIQLNDKNNMRRMSLALGEDRPILQFFDEKERLTWSQPGI